MRPSAAIKKRQKIMQLIFFIKRDCEIEGIWTEVNWR
jgi:hypothetical protein